MKTKLKKSLFSEEEEEEASTSLKLTKMATIKRRSKTTLFFFFFVSLLVFAAFVPVFAPLPSLAPPNLHDDQVNVKKFEIANDMFYRDGQPFNIIGGDLHYFRIPPEYWEDRLLRAKALGLNTIQTYVPWNLHEPRPDELVFEGIADLGSFLKLCHRMGFLVMLRPGPYICAEWDLGGFPSWLLAIKPALRLRSSDPSFLRLVDRWWGVLLPRIAPLLYSNGGPVIMVQIENEFGSYGDDQAYLHHLVALAREHLGQHIILYTTDGGTWETLKKGTIRGDAVFSAVDFSTGEDPWPIFKLQKHFNPPGKSPPLCSEFYTGWLTHWGEKIAKTDAKFTAAALGKILSHNGSAVLYMAHGGTNFGFYNGANTAGTDEFDYKPDLTSYDYDAPIREDGDVDNAKFRALRNVIQQYSTSSLPSVPSNNKKSGYGLIQLQKTALLFDLLDDLDATGIVESKTPISMESVGQVFGFLLYTSEYVAKENGNSLSIPKVHDRAQVYVSCPSEVAWRRPTYVGTIERWSNQRVHLPYVKCVSSVSLYVLVENMGRVNYGLYLSDRKGILSSVFLDGETLYKWKMVPIPLQNLNEAQKISPVFQSAFSRSTKLPSRKRSNHNEAKLKEPIIYAGHFSVNNMSQVTDTYISFSGWGKGIAFVNEFNLGRYWPSVGPQCNLYVPAPFLHHGENSVFLLELESANPELVIHSVNRSDFSCAASTKSKVHIDAAYTSHVL